MEVGDCNPTVIMLCPCRHKTDIYPLSGFGEFKSTKQGGPWSTESYLDSLKS